MFLPEPTAKTGFDPAGICPWGGAGTGCPRAHEASIKSARIAKACRIGLLTTIPKRGLDSKQAERVATGFKRFGLLVGGGLGQIGRGGAGLDSRRKENNLSSFRGRVGIGRREHNLWVETASLTSVKWPSCVV